MLALLDWVLLLLLLSPDLTTSIRRTAKVEADRTREGLSARVGLVRDSSQLECLH